MFGKKRKKEVEAYRSLVEERISEIERKIEDIESEFRSIWRTIDSHRIDNAEARQKMKKDFEKALNGIEYKIDTIKEMVDVLRQPSEKQRRCAFCGRIMTDIAYIGGSRYHEKIIISEASSDMYNPIPICEHCRKLDIDQLSFLYMKILNKQKEE